MIDLTDLELELAVSVIDEHDSPKKFLCFRCKKRFKLKKIEWGNYHGDDVSICHKCFKIIMKNTK
jgi:hypothetical protein